MLLTEEQEQGRDTAREFAQASLAPYSAEWDSQAIFPRTALRDFARGVPNLLLFLGQPHYSYSAACRRVASRAFNNSRATISFCTSVAPS